MADVEERSASIDETPLSPRDPKRRDSLEKHLQHRPDPKELKERHILLDSNAAPSLQAAQQELERQRAADSLKHHLEKRPHKEDLVERNILPRSNAAPGIQAQQRELEKSMRRDSLNEQLQIRPSAETLIKEGVLHNDPTAVDEEDLYEERMEEEYAKREGGA